MHDDVIGIKVFNKLNVKSHVTEHRQMNSAIY